MRHLEHVKKHSLELKDWNKNDFNFECLIFDTESCTKSPIIYGMTTKEIAQLGAKVYGWGLGCTRSDKMIYGQSLNDFIKLIPLLFSQYYEKYLEGNPIKSTKKGYPTTKYYKIPCGVHNLGWDIEFFKYTLAEEGFSYAKGTKKTVFTKGSNYTSYQDIEKPNTYHIVQSEGVVYGSTIYFPFQYTINNDDGSKTKIGVCLDLFDTYKIISCSENQFPQYVNDVDEMFYKMSEQYDYESFRSDTHKQTDLELRYQYNDIYLLKEAIQQFYIDGLCGGEMPSVGKRTASSIAFAKLKEMTFGEKGEQGFISHFELDKTTKFECVRKRLEKYSYEGGFTHASHLYINQLIRKKGCSLDINSSYPSQMAYKKFPYGKPVKRTRKQNPKLSNDEVSIIEVGFDYVRPKKKEYELAIFKITGKNAKALKPLVGDVSAQEYFMTNIHENKVIDVYRSIDNSSLLSNYQTVVTSEELKFWLKHYDFGCYATDQFGCKIESEELLFNGLEYGDGLVYKAEVGRFREFVEYFTEMKVNNKKLGNTPLTNQAKLFLNSAYGKFGTRQEKEELDMVLDKKGIYVFDKDSAEEYTGKEFYRPYASFVTAYGRLQLWNAIIHAVGVENFIYCDTDSIYCFRDEKELTKDMNAIGETIDKTILGKWDVESHFDAFKVLGQKKYMYHSVDPKTKKAKIGNITLIKGNSLKCCGLPRQAQKGLEKQGFNEFYLGKSVDGKLQRKKVIGGALLLETKYELKKVAW